MIAWIESLTRKKKWKFRISNITYFQYTLINNIHPASIITTCQPFNLKLYVLLKRIIHNHRQHMIQDNLSYVTHWSTRSLSIITNSHIQHRLLILSFTHDFKFTSLATRSHAIALRCYTFNNYSSVHIECKLYIGKCIRFINLLHEIVYHLQTW